MELRIGNPKQAGKLCVCVQDETRKSLVTATAASSLLGCLIMGELYGREALPIVCSSACNPVADHVSIAERSTFAVLMALSCRDCHHTRVRHTYVWVLLG